MPTPTLTPTSPIQVLPQALVDQDAIAEALAAAESVHDHAPEVAQSKKLQVLALLGVVLPLLGVIAAGILLWGLAFNWLYLWLLLGMYVITGLGITVGYHRYFTHRSFRTNALGTLWWGITGSMAAEGNIIEWVAHHRKHHQHSDAPDDPHSPHQHDGTAWGIVKGFWHAHTGWFLMRGPGDHADIDRYAPDLRDDKLISWTSRFEGLWLLLGLAIPAAIAGLVTQSWTGALLGGLWGGLVRLFLVHHITWSINSVCHIWGARPFESHDHSRNNVIFGLLGFGEGWHNNHHAFPSSARHGLSWWQFDSSYLVIKLMSFVGLAKDIKVPDKARIESRRRKSGQPRANAARNN